MLLKYCWRFFEKNYAKELLVPGKQATKERGRLCHHHHQRSFLIGQKIFDLRKMILAKVLLFSRFPVWVWNWAKWINPWFERKINIHGSHWCDRPNWFNWCHQSHWCHWRTDPTGATDPTEDPDNSAPSLATSTTFAAFIFALQMIMWDKIVYSV